MQTLQDLALHPGTAIVLTLVLTVWAWKLNATGANWMLVMAWAVGAFTVFRALPNQTDLVTRSLSTMVAAGLFGLLLYVNLWTHPVKQVATLADAPIVIPKMLPISARSIRDHVMTLAHEVELVSGQQFRNEIQLFDGEKLASDSDPQTMFALTPNAGFCSVKSLTPIITAFAGVEMALHESNPDGSRGIVRGYDGVADAVRSLQSMRWVLNAHKYKNGVDLSGGKRFHICLYGLRPVDTRITQGLRDALDKAEAEFLR
jgi:hypothetical protein